MQGYNHVCLIGHLGRDPEMKDFGDNGLMAKLSVATKRVYKDAAGNQVEVTDWHKVIAWRKIAGIVERFLKKGMLVHVLGELRTRKYVVDNKDHWETYVEATNITLLEKYRAPVEPFTATANLPANANTVPNNFQKSIDAVTGGDNDIPI